jgi:hypothetical protein
MSQTGTMPCNPPHQRNDALPGPHLHPKRNEVLSVKN